MERQESPRIIKLAQVPSGVRQNADGDITLHLYLLISILTAFKMGSVLFAE
jgi:hypothetical protein